MNYYKTWKMLGLIGLALILYMSLRPEEGGEVWIEHLDKILHFSTYMIASFYWHQVFQRNRLRLSLLLLSFSAIIEVLQSFTETRSAEWLDLVANCSGIFLGHLISAKFPNVLKLIDQKLKN